VPNKQHPAGGAFWFRSAIGIIFFNLVVDLIGERCVRSYPTTDPWRLLIMHRLAIAQIIACCASFVCFTVYAGFIVRYWERRKRRHICLECGYDLRATPRRCPECGTFPEEFADPRTARGSIH
jgi:hypothetical protein